VCTSDDQLPGNAPEALRMLESALDYLNGPLTGELPAGARGEALVGVALPGPPPRLGAARGAGAVAVRRGA
jgi:hypothetical protein